MTPERAYKNLIAASAQVLANWEDRNGHDLAAAVRKLDRAYKTALANLPPVQNLDKLRPIVGNYSVIWAIDLDARSPRGAALLAREIQQDPESTALVFDTIAADGNHVTVDLMAKRGRR